MRAITMLPRQAAENAYTTLLYRALEDAGIPYVQIPYSLGWLLRRRPVAEFHYLHFHWPEIFCSWRPREPQRLFGLKSFLRLAAFWWLAQRRGWRVVWTVHEVEAHDLERGRRLHAWSRHRLWRIADVVFVHAASVRAEAERRWGARAHVHVVPHGSFAGAYPDVLIAAFRTVQAQHPHAHLLIAGRPHTAAYAMEVQRAAAAVPNLHLQLGFVPDEDVQIFLRAADCFVVPYRHLETSGAIHLAFAFDLPGVMPARGSVLEFESQQVGILMRDPGETEQAMRRMLALGPEAKARLRDGVRSAAGAHAWSALAPCCRAAFEAFERGRQPAGS